MPAKRKLTDRDVRDIRLAAVKGERLKVLAHRYGVKSGYITMLVKGKSRPNAPGPIQPGRHHSRNALRLTDHEIVTIRLKAANGWTKKQLAKEYNVHPGFISEVTLGEKTAKHLPGPLTRRYTQLQAADVEDIRLAYHAGSYTKRELAERYGVSLNAIRNALIGRTWADVPGPIQPAQQQQRRTKQKAAN